MYNEQAQKRYELLSKLEKKYNAKIISIIGIDASSRLDAMAAEKVIRNLQKAGKSREVMIFLNTVGGDIEAGWNICREILGRSATTTMVITNVAKSTGTLISLACPKILVRVQSEFGPTDPQILVVRGNSTVFVPALELLTSGSPAEQSLAKQALSRTKDYLSEVLKRLKVSSNNSQELIKLLLREDENLKGLSHDVPYFHHDLSKFGVNVKVEELDDFCELYSLYNIDPKRSLLEHETHLVEMLTL